MKLIIVENLQKLKMLFNVDCPSVKTVVLMNSKPDDEIPTKEGISVITWEEALKTGGEGSLNEARPTPDCLGLYLPRIFHDFPWHTGNTSAVEFIFELSNTETVLLDLTKTTALPVAMMNPTS